MIWRQCPDKVYLTGYLLQHFFGVITLIKHKRYLFQRTTNGLKPMQNIGKIFLENRLGWWLPIARRVPLLAGIGSHRGGLSHYSLRWPGPSGVSAPRRPGRLLLRRLPPPVFDPLSPALMPVIASDPALPSPPGRVLLTRLNIFLMTPISSSLPLTQPISLYRMCALSAPRLSF